MKENKMTYVAPKVKQVQFKIEKGFAGTNQPILPINARVDNATWQNDQDFNNATNGTYFQR